MTSTPNLAPLLVSLRLTPEQQELIRERTGLTLPTLPYESAASVARYQFAGIELRVNRGVFSPSPATERAVSLVLEVARGYSHPLIVEIGTALDRHVGKPLTRTALAMMRQPAKLAGLSGLQDFLERGFSAFRAMGGADEFLRTIDARETQIMEAIVGGSTDPFPDPLLSHATPTPKA